MRRRLTSGVLVGALALFGAGCGADPEPPAAPDAPEAEAPPGGEEKPGDDFDYSGHFDPAPTNIADDGAIGDYDCDNQEITIDANEVVVFLWGTCQYVNING
jgi:hypothetical protein